MNESIQLQLVEIADEVRLFFHINPINEAEQREKFLSRPVSRASTKNHQPTFAYPELAFSPPDLLARLQALDLESISDQRVRLLFADKQKELANLIRLIQARATTDFKHFSLSLFGKPPPETVAAARLLLAKSGAPEKRELDSEILMELLDSHLDWYRAKYADFECEVVLEPNMSSNMYVHKNRIHVKLGARVSQAAAQCDKHHEIDAHILTYLNGLRQPLSIFRIGLAGSAAFQESLGIFTELASGVFYSGRQAMLAARVVAVAEMLAGTNFGGVFESLTEQYQLDAHDAYTVCQRVFRGGGFTKDWIYVADLWEIFLHWASARDMSLLLLGKVSLRNLALVADLLEEQLLEPAYYKPPYLERIEYKRTSQAVQDLLKAGKPDLAGLFSLAL